MDKYEYKIRSEEIRTLIAKGEYTEAASLADTIDWRRVKSVMMLCTISDLYKINRRYEDARDMLLLAYDRHPGGRSIVYSLCELSIKMGEFVPAVEYYKEFVQVAPKDSGRYILQYKLYEAQEVSLEERIAVLEELKSKDYTEKWAYELAYLYHRVGLGTRCVEECDELIVWFGEGKYVLKALELKRLHEPLTQDQQEKYNSMKGIGPSVEEKPAEEETITREDLTNAPTKVIPQQEVDIQVKLMNVGQYDTINIQKELAENMKELWEAPSVKEPAGAESEEVPVVAEQAEEAAVEEPVAELTEAEPVLEEQTLEAAVEVSQETGILDLPDVEDEEEPMEPKETKVEEVFFGETGEIDMTGTHILEQMKQETLESEEAVEQEKEEIADKPPATSQTADLTERHITKQPTKFDKILGMDYDGQISMVVPEAEQVEKQITGQIRLEEVLVEWEKMKKDSEQKRMEAVRQRVMEQTGAMFTEFDASAKDGLLEQLENGTADSADDAMMQEALSAEETENADFEHIEEPEELTGEEHILRAAAIDGAVVAEEIEAVADTAEAVSVDSEEFTESEDSAAEDNFIMEELEGIEAEDEEETEEAEAEDQEETEEAEAEDEEETEEIEAEDEEEAEEAEAEDEEEAEETEAENEEETEEAEAEDEEETEEAEAEDEEETEEAEAEDEEETEEQDTVKNRQEKKKVRPMSLEEKQLFSAYTQSKSTKEQIINAIDNISMAAFTGNVIITGEEGMDTMTLAKNLIKEVQQTDSNFSGKIAKISGTSLNRKDVKAILDKLANGALIIQGAGALKKETADQIRSGLEQEKSGCIVVMEDTKKAIHKLLKSNEVLKECFNIRIDIEALDNDTLVEIAKEYARGQEYSIDAFGVLALHTCIAERQTSDHAVTVAEVKEIVDDAIWSANRKTIGHFFDILLAKRYDDEDMVILREKDFI